MRLSPSARLLVSIVALAAAGLLAGACDRLDPVQPPTIHLGQDVCDVCHMIISDDRFAAGMVVVNRRGRNQGLAFDDVGCIFEYEAANPDATILARYIRDFSTRQWLDAEQAELVHSRDIHSPMAFGIAAASSLDAARTIQSDFGGELITLAEARRRFEQNVLHVSSLDGNATPVLLESERTVRLEDGRSVHLELHTPQILPPGRHPFETTVSGIEPDAIELRIEPEMPTMGHGSPANEHPVRAGKAGDRFEGLVNFTMAGPWLVHVEIHADGREVGRTAFAFEVKR